MSHVASRTSKACLAKLSDTKVDGNARNRYIKRKPHPEGKTIDYRFS